MALVKTKTPEELEKWIKELDETRQMYKFYKSPEWQTLKEEVLKEQHRECQICKANGRYTPADTVHHVQYVKRHPRLALSKTYTYKGKEYKNLIAICKACHNQVHTEKGFNKKNSAFTNEERW